MLFGEYVLDFLGKLVSVHIYIYMCIYAGCPVWFRG